MDAGQLVPDDAQVLGALRNLNPHQAFHRFGIAVGMAERADAADALGDVAKLMHIALFGELLESAVHKADLRNCFDDAVVLDH